MDSLQFDDQVQFLDSTFPISSFPILRSTCTCVEVRVKYRASVRSRRIAIFFQVSSQYTVPSSSVLGLCTALLSRSAITG